MPPVSRSNFRINLGHFQSIWQYIHVCFGNWGKLAPLILLEFLKPVNLGANCFWAFQKWRISIQSTKTRPGADCGSDHELLITKFRLKLKKVGKTTRPFRYDLNQIPYDYTVQVRNRFKGLDLIECLMNYGWRFLTLYRKQGSRPSPWKRNAKKQNGCLGRPYK